MIFRKTTVSLDGALNVLEKLQGELNLMISTMLLISTMLQSSSTSGNDGILLRAYGEYLSVSARIFMSFTLEERRLFETMEKSVNKKIQEHGSGAAFTDEEQRFFMVVAEHHAINSRYNELAAHAMRRG